jgi:hypothetical protein
MLYCQGSKNNIYENGSKLFYFPFLFDYKIAGKSAETAGYRWQLF